MKLLVSKEEYFKMRELEDECKLGTGSRDEIAWLKGLSKIGVNQSIVLVGETGELSDLAQRLEKAEAALNEINGMSFSLSNLYEAGQAIHRVTFLVQEYFDYKARGEE